MSRWNEVWVYHVDEELTSSFYLPSRSGQLEITAYDWSGQPYRQVFDVVYNMSRIISVPRCIPVCARVPRKPIIRAAAMISTLRVC
ncbi:MAG: hypothetical protein II059_03770 [Clostridia bacterium]|nr:hypothetical protein [Clostridia bacterium]